MMSVPIIELRPVAVPVVPDGDNAAASQASYRSGWEVPLGGALLLLLLVLFAADWMLQPDRFQIEEVRVQGKSGDMIDHEQVKQVVDNALHQNFFSISLGRLEKQVEKIPGVFSASLRRQWPSTIVVNLTEASPLARWGTDKWLGPAGKLGMRQSNDKIDYAVLPQLNGPEGQADVVWAAFQRWSKKFTSIGLSLDALSLSSTGLLDFRISPGALGLQNDLYNQSGLIADTDAVAVTMIVELEHSARVERFLDALDRHGLIRFAEMKTIDLRYPNGFAVSWRDSVTISGTGFAAGGGQP